MGKIRIKKSSRVHIKAAHGIQMETNSAKDGSSEHASYKSQNQIPAVIDKKSDSFKKDLFPVNLSSNPFSNLKINKEQVVKQKFIYPDPQKEIPILKHDDTKALKKKDRIKQRREHFLKKLEVKAAVRAEEKKAIRRSKTPVVGDMEVLKMALPDLSAPIANKKSRKKFKLTKKNKKVQLPVHKKRKFKKKDKAYNGLSDIKDFRKFLKQHKDFKDIKRSIVKKIKNDSL